MNSETKKFSLKKLTAISMLCALANLIKGGLNTVITILLYKPLVTALKKWSMNETESRSA